MTAASSITQPSVSGQQPVKNIPDTLAARHISLTYLSCFFSLIRPILSFSYSPSDYDKPLTLWKLDSSSRLVLIMEGRVHVHAISVQQITSEFLCIFFRLFVMAVDF